jgi:hypothetical protein
MYKNTDAKKRCPPIVRAEPYLSKEAKLLQEQKGLYGTLVYSVAAPLADFGAFPPTRGKLLLLLPP